MFTHIECELPKLKRQNIDGARYYTVNGRPMVSITSVTSHWNKQIFVDWRKRIGEAEANRITKQSTDIGSMVHEALENYLKKKDWDNFTNDQEGVIASKITKKGSTPVSLEELANHSDFLSLHAPAIDATKHIISRDFLGKMKTSSKLINCSRGSLGDEQALAEAVNKGHLSGAALDVLDGEPPDPNSPLFDAPNVLITPHMAGSTRECLETIANTAMQDIVRVLRGKKPLHSVNTPR